MSDVYSLHVIKWNFEQRDEFIELLSGLEGLKTDVTPIQFCHGKWFELTVGADKLWLAAIDRPHLASVTACYSYISSVINKFKARRQTETVREIVESQSHSLPPAAPPDMKRDALDMTHDTRVHTWTAFLNADGTWRRKRNVSDIKFEAVKQEQYAAHPRLSMSDEELLDDVYENELVNRECEVGDIYECGITGREFKCTYVHMEGPHFAGSAWGILPDESAAPATQSDVMTGSDWHELARALGMPDPTADTVEMLQADGPEPPVPVPLPVAFKPAPTPRVWPSLLVTADVHAYPGAADG